MAINRLDYLDDAELGTDARALLTLLPSAPDD